MIPKIKDIFFPRRCPLCDKTIPSDVRICKKCRPKVVLIEGKTCRKCGKPMESEEELYCYDCRSSPRRYERGFAVFEYGCICDSLYRFKYSKRAEYAEFYAWVTAKRYKEELRRLGIQAFIPVPVHKSRYKKRGYNQALEFARELSLLTDIPVLPDIIIRAKKTKAQKELTPLERQKNLKKAFKLSSYGVKLQSVCVVDDIYTTGSTINAIAELLKQTGIREVYFVTIAIGRGF